MFNGPHPETGEELEVVDEIRPRASPPHDLPAAAGRVRARTTRRRRSPRSPRKLRKAAGLPKEPTGVVANNGSTNGKSSSTKAKKKAKVG